LLSEAFDTSPQLWLNLQMLHDLAHRRPRRRVASLVPARAAG
jgi:plasmid maintenance system antidote protein VapI